MTMELFLSRLVLDQRSRDVRRDLSDCHAMHRRVMSAFPQSPAGASARERYCVLHRIDTEAGRPPQLLVQSGAKPNWSHLPSGYLVAERDNSAVKDVSSFYERIETGARLRFRLRANPTRKIDTKSIDGRRRNGRRVEHTRDEDRVAWLARKGEASGFQLVDARLQPRVHAMLVRTEDKVVGRAIGSGSRVTYSAALFDGLLDVVDAVSFRRVLTAGIGPGKAFGFGLLSIARADRATDS